MTVNTIVYADILILINFCVDFICLFLAARICAVPARAWRLTLGSLAGALYMLVTLYVSSLPLHLAAGALICLISVGKKRFLAVFACFFMLSSLLGGLFTAVANLTSGGFEVLYALVPAAVASFVFAMRGKRRIEVRTVTVSINDGDLTLRIEGLVDTGNLITDPLSGDAVILVKSSEFSAGFEVSARHGYRALPASGVGHALLFAFRPETVGIRSMPFGHFENRRAIVAVDESEGSYAGCAALVPKSLV